MKHPLCAAVLAASAAFGLSGCVTDDYGYGGGFGYAAGGYYGDPYWGWYDDYYYPGSGFYIYDRGGHRQRWNDRQRAYWQARRGNHPGQSNWSGYRSGLSAEQLQQRRGAWRAQRQQQGSASSGHAWRSQSEAPAQSGATSSGRGGGDWGGGGGHWSGGGRRRGD